MYVRAAEGYDIGVVNYAFRWIDGDSHHALEWDVLDADIFKKKPNTFEWYCNADGGELQLNDATTYTWSSRRVER